jgi:hypothetical protein
VLEQFLAAIRKHGFSVEEGVQLFHAIGTLTIGAAAGAIGLKASRAAGASWPAAMRVTLSERDAEELPLVRRVFPHALDINPHQWLPALHALLAGVAAARGETLPRSAQTPAIRLNQRPRRRPQLSRSPVS